MVVGKSQQPERSDLVPEVGEVAARAFPRPVMVVEVEAVSGDGVREPLRLLEKPLRGGEPLSHGFVSRMERSVEAGDIEVLAAREGGRAIGVLVLAFRPNVSLGGMFASIEDLYVEPGSRRRGVGRKLLEAVAERCRGRNVSYVEVHAEEKEAMVFYERVGYERESDVRVFSRAYPLPGIGSG